MKTKTVRYAVEYLDMVDGREVEKVEVITMTRESTAQDAANVVARIVVARINERKDFPCTVRKRLDGGLVEYCGKYMGMMTGSEVRRQNMMFQWLKGGNK